MKQTSLVILLALWTLFSPALTGCRKESAQGGAGAPPARVAVGEGVPIDAVEVEHIRRVLASSPTLEDAARTLGIDPSTLYRKRKKYGLL